MLLIDLFIMFNHSPIHYPIHPSTESFTAKFPEKSRVDLPVKSWVLVIIFGAANVAVNILRRFQGEQMNRWGSKIDHYKSIISQIRWGIDPTWLKCQLHVCFVLPSLAQKLGYTDKGYLAILMLTCTSCTRNPYTKDNYLCIDNILENGALHFNSVLDFTESLQLITYWQGGGQSQSSLFVSWR